MIATVVKIDLVASKSVAAAQQGKNPGIRTQLLEQLLKTTRSAFPQSSESYPTGSYYRAEGDAVYFILTKPTVALRASIEFMQSWFNVTVTDLERCPDCRIMIDRGEIQAVETPGGKDFVGTPFENIAVGEKKLQGGRIYLTQDVISHCDKTMTRFVHYATIATLTEKVPVYYAEFLDPRTTNESALLHALFISHPKSQDARDRVLELFILEYLLEKTVLTDFTDFNKWARHKSYSPLPHAKLKELCDQSSYIDNTAPTDTISYSLSDTGLAALKQSQDEFQKAREECIQLVLSSIVNRCGTPRAIEGHDIAQVIEDYLCAIFSEIRMMANYFRETSEVFDADSNLLERFDYVLKRHFVFSDHPYFSEWKHALLKGLQLASRADNRYVAAIFHNVLATYYLNRSPKSSAYQVDKLKQRILYIDTNVLYASRVAASSYHEVVRYFIDRLAQLELVINVFPFTIEEYEASLALVAHEVKKNEVSTFLLRWNPWLYQEYMRNRNLYLGEIEVCRQLHSVAKGYAITPDAYDSIDTELHGDGARLDREYRRLSEEERNNVWSGMRQYMTSSRWSLDEYYDFVHGSTKSLPRIAHDADCIQNLAEKFSGAGRDELGPRLMFITLDRQLARCRKGFEFIFSSEQFIEFMMPYLFLSDIPISNAEKFPNQLLSAQLGTLLIARQVEATDLVGGFLSDPQAAEQYASGKFGAKACEIATALSSSKLNEIVNQTRELGESQRREIAKQIGERFKEMEMQQKTSYFENHAARVRDFTEILNEKDKQIDKLRNTVRYFRQQSSRKHM